MSLTVSVAPEQSLRQWMGGLPPTVDRRMLRAEVEAGLPNEKHRLAEALENRAFYNHDEDRYLPRHDAESEFDFQGRPRRRSGFLRQVVDILTEHLYCPGPNRLLKHATADAQTWLSAVYEQTHIDERMHAADLLATLNNACAIQVECTGDELSPVRLHLWSAEEFHVFVDPSVPTEPVAVVTIDRYDGQTRYRLWFPDEVLTFLTSKWTQQLTSGGTTARFLGAEPNTYGCLPFAFAHFRTPISDFFEAGIGRFVREVQKRVDVRLSDLDETMQKYMYPLGIATGVDVAWNPEIAKGRFLRLPASAYSPGGGDYSGGAEPRLTYLQAQIDVTGVWEDLNKLMGQALEVCRIPPTAARLETVQIASGIQLIVEQAPLLTRAQARRRLFQRVETQLARVILLASGNFYGRPALLEAANTGKLVFSWPEPTIPIPGPDRDHADQWELQMGITSRIEVIQRRRGLSRDQAIEVLRQIAEDEKLASELLPATKPVAGDGATQESDVEDQDDEYDKYE